MFQISSAALCDCNSPTQARRNHRSSYGAVRASRDSLLTESSSSGRLDQTDSGFHSTAHRIACKPRTPVSAARRGHLLVCNVEFGLGPVCCVKLGLTSSSVRRVAEGSGLVARRSNQRILCQALCIWFSEPSRDAASPEWDLCREDPRRRMGRGLIGRQPEQSMPRRSGYPKWSRVAWCSTSLFDPMLSILW